MNEVHKTVEFAKENTSKNRAKYAKRSYEQSMQNDFFYMRGTARPISAPGRN